MRGQRSLAVSLCRNQALLYDGRHAGTLSHVMFTGNKVIEIVDKMRMRESQCNQSHSMHSLVLVTLHVNES